MAKREEAVGRNGNRRGERGKRGRRDYEFKWPSQDNSKNAFKRKSVKEFRLWATDCLERGIDCRRGGGTGREGRGKTAIEAAQFESAPDAKNEKLTLCRPRAAGQEMENATVDRDRERNKV